MVKHINNSQLFKRRINGKFTDGLMEYINWKEVKRTTKQVENNSW